MVAFFFDWTTPPSCGQSPQHLPCSCSRRRCHEDDTIILRQAWEPLLYLGRTLRTNVEPRGTLFHGDTRPFCLRSRTCQNSPAADNVPYSRSEPQSQSHSLTAGHFHLSGIGRESLKMRRRSILGDDVPAHPRGHPAARTITSARYATNKGPMLTGSIGPVGLPTSSARPRGRPPAPYRARRPEDAGPTWMPCRSIARCARRTTQNDHGSGRPKPRSST